MISLLHVKYIGTWSIDMDIVIIANFCAALDRPTNSRFDYIANMLAEENSVEMVGSSFSHETKKKRVCDFSRFSYKVTLIDEPGYHKNISVQRFLSHRIWGKNVLKYIQQRKKPDVIYCAIPSLTAASLVGEYCNRTNIRFVVDIQDLWPESFRMALNVPVMSNVAFAPFKHRANKAYAAADLIIAVSQTFLDRAESVNMRANDSAAVYIGTDLGTFDNNVCKHKVERKGDGEFWIAYCGSLSDSYDIPCVIDAVKLINNPKVKLIIMGTGYLKDNFQKLAVESGINAEFTGYLNYPEMCGLLSSCDITVNPINGKSVASIINKHADYAASGLPVINTQESPEYRNLVEDYNMGFNCKNGNTEEIAEKIKTLIEDKSLRDEMGRNARRCAVERFDRMTSYCKLKYCIME